MKYIYEKVLEQNKYTLFKKKKITFKRTPNKKTDTKSIH